MLLMKLQAKEKFAFLHLSHYLARIDGEYGEREQDVIAEYCVEMGIENTLMFDESEFNLKETLNAFKSLKSKRIVVLELMILVHIDNRFDLKEYELTNEIIQHFKLDIKELKHYSAWGKAVSALYEQGKNFINEE
jgi:hypothetical protein